MATKPVTFNVSSFIKGNEGAKDHTIIQELPATSGADRGYHSSGNNINVIHTG